METLEYDEVLEYLKHFDRIFNTKLETNFNIDELILFFRGLKKVIDEITPTDKYLVIQKEKNQLLKAISFNNEQLKFFNKYCEFEQKTDEIYRKELVIFMYVFMKCF